MTTYWRLVFLGALFLGAVACSAGRSTEAFCDTFNSETERLAEKYRVQAAEISELQDPLFEVFAGMGALLEAQGDQVVMLERLADVAPEEIRHDVEAIRDSAKQQLELTQAAAGNPIASLFGGLAAGSQSLGSARQVDAFLIQNCDV